MSDDINVGQLSEAINNKLDIGCMNANHTTTPVGLNTNNMPVVITTCVNGTSGYRIWADGYCEQWGKATINNTTITVALGKTFKDTNYNVTVSGGIGSSYYCPQCKNTSVDSFELYNFNTAIAFNYWKASGYLADGQY